MIQSIRPTVDISVQSFANDLLYKRERGVVVMPLKLDFGVDNSIIEIQNEMDIDKYLGGVYQSTILIKEAIKKAKKVLVYKVNNGTKARFKVTNDFTIETKQTGSMANLISLKIEEIIDENTFKITTFFNNIKKCVDIVLKESNHYENDYITYDGKILKSSGIFLTGGTSEVTTKENYVKFFNVIEKLPFDVLCIPTKDNDIKNLALAFTKRMREVDNKKIITVLDNFSGADYEGVVSVKNGVILQGGQVIKSVDATAFIAGLMASTLCNKSNTYEVYSGATDIDTSFSNTEIENNLKAGHIVFSKLNDTVIIEKDINTFTSFSPYKSQMFSKNRIIRVIDQVTSYIRELFLFRYLGKVNNDNNGRLLFKADIIKYMTSLKEMNAIEEFDSTSDIEIIKGDDIESIKCNISLKPIDSLEKILVKINI